MNRYIKRRKEEARLKDLCILNDALNYIEDNLCGELSQAEIAAVCCCSLSALQKLFRYAFNISVGDYITRRRLTCCARELVGTDRSVLDIALDHGYSSPEAFTRAFSRMWESRRPLSVRSAALRDFSRSWSPVITEVTICLKKEENTM